MELSDDIIESVLPAIEDQLVSEKTPYVKDTFERLTTQDQLTPEDAKFFMAQALLIVMNQMLLTGRPFDENEYKQLLKVLPALPDESGNDL